MHFYGMDAFRMAVAGHRNELADNGITFKTKARMQSEMYLEDVNDIILNADTPPSVKLNAIQSVVRWAGLEPEKPKPVSSTTVNNNVKLEICWGNPVTGETIDI